MRTVDDIICEICGQHIKDDQRIYTALDFDEHEKEFRTAEFHYLCFWGKYGVKHDAKRTDKGWISQAVKNARKLTAVFGSEEKT